MRKVLEKFFDTLRIISTLIILFAVMVVGFISLGLPAFIMLFIISILG